MLKIGLIEMKEARELHMHLLGIKNSSGRRNSQYKSSTMRTHIMCSRNSKKAIDRGKLRGEENKEVRSES